MEDSSSLVHALCVYLYHNLVLFKQTVTHQDQIYHCCLCCIFRNQSIRQTLQHKFYTTVQVVQLGLLCIQVCVNQGGSCIILQEIFATQRVKEWLCSGCSPTTLSSLERSEQEKAEKSNGCCPSICVLTRKAICKPFRKLLDFAYRQSPRRTSRKYPKGPHHAGK